jgi:hypothetical protein
MTGEEKLRLVVTFAVWGLMVAGAIRIFGLRRVLWGVALVVVFAVLIAFRALGAITGGRR